MEEKESGLDRSAMQIKRISKQKNKGRRGLGFIPKQSEASNAFEETKKRNFHAKIEKIEKEKNGNVSSDFAQEINQKKNKEDIDGEEKEEFSKFADLKRKTLKSKNI